MPDSTANLGLPYILPSQAQKHVTHNAALDTVDALVQLRVESRSTLAPPSNPTPGQCYIVPATGAGDWTGHDAEIAVWRESYWAFLMPKTGWQAYVIDELLTTIFDGIFWGGRHWNDKTNPTWV